MVVGYAVCPEGLGDRVLGVPLWGFLSLWERGLRSLDTLGRSLRPRFKLDGMLVLRVFTG